MHIKDYIHIMVYDRIFITVGPCCLISSFYEYRKCSPKKVKLSFWSYLVTELDWSTGHFLFRAFLLFLFNFANHHTDLKTVFKDCQKENIQVTQVLQKQVTS